MIDVKDVVRIKLPFPNSTSGLAMSAHMYICLRRGAEKTMVKCQTMRPTFLSHPHCPKEHIVEEIDISRNPFQSKTLIDCDKVFLINGVEMDLSLLTTSRKDICDPLFSAISRKIQHPRLQNHVINNTDLLALNRLIRIRQV